MRNPGQGMVRLTFRIPARGLFGYRSEFLTATRGTGIMHHRFLDYGPWAGPLAGRKPVPGAESRWSGGKDLSWAPIEPGVVAEVSYDQLEGGRFRHATRFHRWRPDKDPHDCTIDQLERPEGLGFSQVIA